MLIVASSGTAQSLNIVNVKVEGNRSSSTELILSVADLKTGEPLNSSLTQDAIKRLYGLGFFRDVSIDALETTGGINLIIRVVELPKLMGLNFQGSKTIKAKELREKLKLNIGGTISSNLIYEKKSEINKLYAEKGYFLAEVEHKLSYSSDSSEVVLTYEIDEGSKIKVDKVVLTGNVRVPGDDIIGKMRNRKRGFLKSSNFDKEKYPDDKEKIIDYLHKSGYSDAYLKSDSFRIDTAVNRMIIYLDIYEGPRYYFGKTDWKGNEIFGIKELKRALKYKENRVFNQENFDESVYEIYFLYQEKGYMHTRVIDDHKTRDTLIDIT
ncbi:MAG: hypothetical protein NTV06_02990, partial [candidate division Zixibacteria bacterium]|nr:hypothetical protein [candidate division Zixibacteria bacterium]